MRVRFRYRTFVLGKTGFSALLRDLEVTGASLAEAFGTLIHPEATR
jgi:hypothetical protein